MDARKFHDALTTANIEYSGLSWGGFNLFGNRKSINEAMRLLHEAGKVPVLMRQIVEERQRAQGLNDAAKIN